MLSVEDVLPFSTVFLLKLLVRWLETWYFKAKWRSCYEVQSSNLKPLCVRVTAISRNNLLQPVPFRAYLGGYRIA